MTGSDPKALHRLLRTLASLGVFAEDAEGRFGLTPLADGLRSNAAVSLRAFSIMLGEDMLWRPLGRSPSQRPDRRGGLQARVQ